MQWVLMFMWLTLLAKFHYVFNLDTSIKIVSLFANEEYYCFSPTAFLFPIPLTDTELLACLLIP